MERLKKVTLVAGKWALRLLIVLASVLMLFEILYRWQVFDAYKTELNALNRPEDLESSKRRILVMGDSFSATQESYTGILRDSLPEYSIINSAVPGTGPLQALFMAPGRIKRFAPQKLIYQVYSGNDLFDIRYPMNWETVSRSRNFYWYAANHLRSLSYINYKLGQFTAERPDFTVDSLLKSRKEFSPETYNQREKIYLAAEPSLIESSVRLKGIRGLDYLILMDAVKGITDRCTGDCEVYLLFIPHCAQVSREYLYRMEQIGAEFQDPEKMMETEYPFCTAIYPMLSGMSNIHIVNPLDSLQAAERRGIQTYYSDDPHLTPEGQKIVADYLLRSLADDEMRKR